MREYFRRTLLTLGATVGLIQAYALPVRWNRGPEGAWWESIRRWGSRILGHAFDEGAGPRPITVGEYAGSLDRPVDETERLLFEWGFIRNPFARLKTRDGEYEAGSWVYRERPLASRQLHLMLFARADGGTDVYAHEEPSSVHPLRAAVHFDGDGQSLANGVERARGRLPLETAAAPADSPAGAWTESRPDRSGDGPRPGPADAA